jgi:hypothetical protein
MPALARMTTNAIAIQEIAIEEIRDRLGLGNDPREYWPDHGQIRT